MKDHAGYYGKTSMDLMIFTLLSGEKKGVIHTSGSGTIEFTGAEAAAHGGANFITNKKGLRHDKQKEIIPKTYILGCKHIKG
jgi:hypothetical protein